MRKIKTVQNIKSTKKGNKNKSTLNQKMKLNGAGRYDKDLRLVILHYNKSGAVHDIICEDSKNRRGQ